MSISAVSPVTPATPVQPLRAHFSTIQRDIILLSQSLSASDLTGARRAFTDIQNLLRIGVPEGPGLSVVTLTPVEADFLAIGKALVSGDVLGAQAAFAQFKIDVSAAAIQAAQTNHGNNHHRRHRHVEPPPIPDYASGPNSTINLLG